MKTSVVRTELKSQFNIDLDNFTDEEIIKACKDKVNQIKKYKHFTETATASLLILGAALHYRDNHANSY